MISKKLALDVINESLKTGADYSEIFYEDTRSHTVLLENSKVNTSNSSSLCGVGLRLLKDNRSVYGYTNDLSRKGLLTLSKNLSASFNGERQLSIDGFKQIKFKNRNPITDSYDNHNLDEQIALVREGLDEISSLNNPRIVRTQGAFATVHQHVTVFNSKGKTFSRESEFGRMFFIVIAASEKGIETAFEGPGTQQDISYFKNKLNIRDLARKTAETALKMLDADECPSGKMDVVIGNGWGGVLFHESCGHPLEASAVSRNLSPFANKVGEMVASPVVSAYDDSTIPGAWGSIDIDDEGNLGEKRLLIKNGVLQNYMIDDFNGRRMDRSGNGACRRQNYRYCPTSRMSNTYIDNGTSTPEEIIKATKLGLYAVSFKGGSVNPTTGEFNFGCSEAYIIRDVKICEPVKGATLIGKGHEILKDIDMVANDLALGEGMCGAASGSIRTCVGQPTLRIRNIMVGGRGGALK